jgi:hypothetical protein
MHRAVTLVFGLVLALAAPASAATRVPRGQTAKAVLDAASLLQPGDTLLLRGTYDFTDVSAIPAMDGSGLFFPGATMCAIPVTAPGVRIRGDRAVLVGLPDDPDNGKAYVGFLVMAANVSIESISFENFSIPICFGFLDADFNATPADAGRVAGCRFDRPVFGVYFGAGSGIDVLGSTAVSPAIGVFIDGLTGALGTGAIRVEGNEVDQPTETGLHLQIIGDAPTVIAANRVTGQTATDIPGLFAGIRLSFATNASISGNYLDGNYRGLLLSNNAHVDIIGNVIKRSQRAAIVMNVNEDLVAPGTATIRWNMIANNAGPAVAACGDPAVTPFGDPAQFDALTASLLATNLIAGNESVLVQSADSNFRAQGW